MFEDVRQVAMNKPAMLLHGSMVEAMLLAGMQAERDALDGRSVPTYRAGIEVSLHSISAMPGQQGVTLDAINDRTFVSMPGQVDIELSLHLAGDPNSEFSRIGLTLNAIAFDLSVERDTLITLPPSVQVQGSVVPAPTRAAALAAANAPSEVDVSRTEGALAFLLAPRIVASALGAMPAIALRSVYPNLAWEGGLSLHVVGPYLAIVPAGRCEIVADTGCPDRRSTPDWDIEAGSAAQQPELGEGGIEVPMRAHVPAREYPGGSWQPDPSIALYLPQAVLDSKFKDIYPAVEFHTQDSGFIGTSTEGVVGLEGVKVDLDGPKLGLHLGLEVHLSGKANLNVDVPCVGRVPLAYTTKLEIAPTSAKAFVGIELTWGGLSIRTMLEEVNIGTITIYVIFIPDYLIFAGGAGWLWGFILDRVVDRILAWNVRLAVQKAIEDASTKGNFKLIDFHDFFPWLPKGLKRASTHIGNDYVVWGVGQDG